MRNKSSKYDFVCIHCGKKFYNCDRGPTYIPKYCSRECFHKHIQRVAICAQCGKEFTWEKKGRERKDPQYCSQACHYASGKKKCVCKMCGKEFTVIKSQKGIYCSRECSENDRDLSKTKTFVCQWCGKEFNEWAYRNPTLCSNQCRSEYGGSIRGKQLYNGGSVKSRGMNWKKQARAARKRDNYTCQVCGRNGYVHHFRVQVHHIIPFREFNGNYESANSLYNLVSLCPSCHPKVECGYIKLSSCVS